MGDFEVVLTTINGHYRNSATIYSMRYIIVAYDRQRAIGANNTLPWAGRMKTDMRRVRELTTGNAIIMGRRTFESIGRPLPNRQNIVVTTKGVDVPGVLSVASLDEAYNAVDAGKHAFIFGGGKLYASAIDTVDEIIATEIDTVIEGADVFFPELGDNWRESSREHFDADDENIYAFDFVLYTRS